MTSIHNNEVNHIAKCSLLNDIINLPKLAKTLNICYSTILRGCMNTRNGKAKFKNFCILLENGFSSTIVIERLIEKLYPGKYALVQLHTEAGNVTINIQVRVDFTLHALSATNVMEWRCHVDDSAKGRHNMIPGRDILTEL